MIYTIPSFHNPTGWTLTAAAAPAPARARPRAEHGPGAGMLLVEDDSYALTRFEGEREPALFDLSGKTTHLHLVVLDHDRARPAGRLAHPARAARRRARGETRPTRTSRPSLLSQATVFEFITRGSFEPHLGELRAGLRLRRDAMLAALARHMPEANWSRPEGGYFVWVELPGAARRPRRAGARAGRHGASRGRRSARCRAGCGSRTARVAPDEIEAGVERTRGRAVGLASQRCVHCECPNPGLQSRCRNPARQGAASREASRPQNHGCHRRLRRSAGAGGRRLAGRRLVDDPRVLRRGRAPDVHLPRRNAGREHDPARHVPGDLRQPRRGRSRRRPRVPSLRAGRQLPPAAVGRPEHVQRRVRREPTYTLQDDLHPALERRTFLATTAGGGPSDADADVHLEPDVDARSPSRTTSSAPTSRRRRASRCAAR